MDIYLTSLALGGVGLVAMSIGGFGREGHGHAAHGHGAHTGDALAGHGHGGHGHPGDGHAGHIGHAGHGGHGQPGDHGHHAGARDAIASSLLSLMSPRVLFSVALGLGTSGLLLRPFIGGIALFAAALLGGVLFERFIVTPIWNFTFRFASNPALTLESAIMGEATAVTSFDANGQGLIAIEVDGQVVQLLGTLQRSDQELRVRVPAGARLRVEDVDAARNRCSVSLL